MKLTLELAETTCAHQQNDGTSVVNPLFLSPNGVSGLVRFDFRGDVERLPGLVMVVHLLGFVHTSIVFSETAFATLDNSALVFDKTILNLAQRHVLQQPDSEIVRDEIKCHFRFALSTTTADSPSISPDGVEEYLHNVGKLFPPSLERRSSVLAGLQNSGPECSASIRYVVRATLLQGDVVLATTEKDVNIFPCSRIAPPLFPADFGAEYILQHESSIRKGLFRRIGLVAVRAVQPGPFVFTDLETTAITEIPLQLTLRTSNNDMNIADLGHMSIEINWKLQSTTFVSMIVQNGLPTVRQATVSPYLGSIVACGDPHRLKLNWSSWAQTALGDTGAREWTATCPIYIACKSASALAPTFSSPWITLRYSVILDVNMSRPFRSKANLKLPIQVVYQATNSAMRRGSLDVAQQSAMKFNQVQERHLRRYET